MIESRCKRAQVYYVKAFSVAFLKMKLSFCNYHLKLESGWLLSVLIWRERP